MFGVTKKGEIGNERKCGTIGKYDHRSNPVGVGPRHNNIYSGYNIMMKEDMY